MRWRIWTFWTVSQCPWYDVWGADCHSRLKYQGAVWLQGERRPSEPSFGLDWQLLHDLLLALSDHLLLRCCSDEGVLPEVLAAMQGAAIKGLSACGVDAPFTAIFEKQERCAAEVQAGGMHAIHLPLLRTIYTRSDLCESSVQYQPSVSGLLVRTSTIAEPLLLGPQTASYGLKEDLLVY